MGRLVGLLVLQIAEAVCDPHYAAWMAPHFLPLVEWLRANGAMSGAEGMECNWLVDPGNYALAGARPRTRGERVHGPLE